VMSRHPMPDDAVAGSLDELMRKRRVAHFDLLKASDVRLGLFQPLEKPWHTPLDAVDVEPGDLHFGTLGLAVTPRAFIAAVKVCLDFQYPAQGSICWKLTYSRAVAIVH
jgi:hypothetical protein